MLLRGSCSKVLAIAAMLAGCPPPEGDLGPYTSAQTGAATTQPDEAGATATAGATSTGGEDGGSTGAADTTTAGATTTGVSGTSDTGEVGTTVMMAPTSGETTDTAASEETGATTMSAGDCGPMDPLHPFPTTYAALGDIEVHGACVLQKVGPGKDVPAFTGLDLACEDGAVHVEILDGPLADWGELVGESFEVDLVMQTESPDEQRQWVVFRRAGALVYATMVGATFVAEGMDPEVYAPLRLDAVEGPCALAPTTTDWPPLRDDGFACEFTAPIYLAVRVGLDPPVPLKAGAALDAPVKGGMYRVEVRTMVRGNNCIPGPPSVDVDLYAFAVAFQQVE